MNESPPFSVPKRASCQPCAYVLNRDTTIVKLPNSWVSAAKLLKSGFVGRNESKDRLGAIMEGDYESLTTLPIIRPGSTPAPAEMTCEEAEALLPLVADGVLQSEDDPALFQHLARCPRCQQSLATYDLIDLAISQDTPSQERRHWQLDRWAAGCIGCGGWFISGSGLALYRSATNDRPNSCRPGPITCRAGAKPFGVIAVSNGESGTERIYCNKMAS